MFSSFTSFLPASLQTIAKGKDQPEEHESDDPATPSDDVPSRALPPRHESLSNTQAEAPATPARPPPAQPRRPREKPLSETFIIVRPPPAKNNHPLNLQIQLVPQRPQNREPSVSVSVTSNNRRQSGDFSSEAVPVVSPAQSTFSQNTNNDGGDDLRRVASVRSNYSDRSAGFYQASASGSVTSFASSSAGSSSGVQRRIVPLYNLSAHNVMTNTVTDAGTDAKVAKFQKRGLEIMRVGTWEPIEVWSKPGRSGSPGSASSQQHLQTDDMGMIIRAPSLTQGGSVLNASAFSHESGGGQTPMGSPSMSKKPSGSGHRRTASVEPTTPTPQPPPSGAKKFFGKMFNPNNSGSSNSSNSKKRPGTADAGSSGFSFPSLNLPTSTPPGSPNNRSSFLSTGSGAGGSRRLSAIIPGSSSLGQSHSNRSHDSQQSGSTTTTTSGSHVHGAPLYPSLSHASSSHSHYHGDPPLQPPVLGLQAALHASGASGAQLTGRPTAYVWVLRKWAKEKTLGGESIFRGLVTAAQGLQLNAAGGNGNGKRGDDDPANATEVEVRFEWARGKSASKEREKQRLAGVGASPAVPGTVSRTVSDSSSRLGLPSVDDNHSMSSKNTSRASLVDPAHTPTPASKQHPPQVPNKRHSVHVSDARRSASRSASVDTAEDGDDSDAEDSETPWTCTLNIYPSHLSPLTEAEMKQRASVTAAGLADAIPKDGRIRLKLAMLVPTPHHPKIIGQCKTPFPLPDVAITPHAPMGAHAHRNTPRAGVYDGTGVGARFLPRTIGPDGVLRAADGAQDMNVMQEVLFTAEDIKDVVSSTGLWLVVREGFGGIGRTKRKGDGWHIRA